jgi:hypothetical protein
MAPQAPIRPRRILAAGLAGALLDTFLAFMLHAVVTHTPAEVSPHTYVLFFVIFCVPFSSPVAAPQPRSAQSSWPAV